MQLNNQILKRRRVDLNITQTQLAGRLTTQATISKMESTGFIPTLEILIPTLEKLNLTLEETLLKSETRLTVLKNINELISTSPREAIKQIEKIQENSLKNVFEKRLFWIIKAKTNFFDNKIDEADFYASSILELDNKFEDEIEYTAKSIKAKTFTNRGNFQIAEKYFYQVRNFLNKSDIDIIRSSPNQFLQLYLDVAEFSLERHNFVQASDEIKKAIILCRRINNLNMMVELLFMQLRISTEWKDNILSIRLSNALLVMAEVLRKEKILKFIKNFSGHR